MVISTARRAGERVLVKHSLANALRRAMMEGTLAPGQRIVEAAWAARFGVAQASVREAINILIAEGFVQKKAGRSARVINLREADIAKIYELRGAFEGLAARLVTVNGADLTALESTVREIEEAARRKEFQRGIAADLQFHLSLCELSGNAFLYESARRVLLPLFAFVLIRVHEGNGGIPPWAYHMETHARLLRLIKEGDPFLAEQYIMRLNQRLAENGPLKRWVTPDEGGVTRSQGELRQDRAAG